MIVSGLRKGAGDTVSEEWLKESVKTGNMALWAIHSGTDVTAVVILESIQYPKHKALSIILVAGSRFHEWEDEVEKLLMSLADLIGADTLESTCRHGMSKWLKNRGWRKKATLMEITTKREKYGRKK